ncbi:MAG: TlpA family protein disulfide reductase, partial [Muribaculaceae bacterium]|nr:TlpA family protein disulfide reductase [Muribaculaceae bacterium]
MRTSFSHVIINNNDSIWVTLTDDKGGAIRRGGELNAKLQDAADSLNNITAKFLKGEISPEDGQRMSAKYFTEQITENISNLYGGYMLSVSSYILTPDEWLELYHQLPAEIAAYPRLANTTMRLKSQIETQEGAMFKDFQCLTPDRTSVRLSDYVGKGKYTLLDFWATWCGPCRQEAKETILPIYEKYKDHDNFRVISVMTSDSIDNHLKGLSTLNYPWQQLIDVEDISGNLFGFNSIPFITLIDPEGKIIRRNIRGEEIWQAVEAVLNKD